MERKNLIEIPIIKGSINNWFQKKKEINKFIDNIDLKNNGHFSSSRDIKCEEFKKNFVSIFQEDIEKVVEFLGVSLNLTDVWIVRYFQGEEHYVHNHGSRGFSGIIYLDYDKEIHESTKYLLPFNHPITDNSVIVNEEVKEGDIVLVPSFINHFVPYNKSNKKRSIIGLDFNIN